MRRALTPRTIFLHPAHYAMDTRHWFARLAATALLPMMLLLAVPACSAQESAVEDQGQWTMLTPASDSAMHRHENAYVKVGDRFYLIGGRGERPVQIYDPTTRTWTTGATPPLSMHHFQAVSYDGKIYVLGAFNGNYPDETPIPNVYIYDPATDQWTEGPEIPADRRRGAAGAVAHEGTIYLVGGIQNGHIDGHVRWMDAFDPDTGTWTQLADAPRFRDHFQVAIVDGKLYAAGGRRSSQATGQVFQLTVPEVDVYDIATNTWSPLPPSGDLPTERAGTTTVAAGGHIIVLGGESGSQEPAHAEVEALDPETGTWQSLAPMNVGRHGTQAIVHDGHIYVAAGSRTRGATEINSQERFTLPAFLQNE